MNISINFLKKQVNVIGVQKIKREIKEKKFMAFVLTIEKDK